LENSTSFRVAFGDTDGAAIVFYPNYLRWFDQGTHNLLRAAGHPTGGLLAQGIVIPVIEAQIRYYASLYFDEEVTLTSRIAEVRTRAFRIEHAVRRGEDLVCEGSEVRMWVRAGEPQEAMRPEPIPEQVRAALSR